MIYLKRNADALVLEARAGFSCALVQQLVVDASALANSSYHFSVEVRLAHQNFSAELFFSK